MIKVLIVDDHSLVRTGIKRMLEDVEGFKIIGEAQSGEEAIALSKIKRPHVVLMDVKMPGIGGLEATRELLALDPEIKVLVVTVCTDGVLPSRLLQAGACGYLTKGASMEEMIRAIRMVHLNQRYISPEIANRLALRHLTDAGNTPFENLSERELQVALMIVNAVKVNDVAKKLSVQAKTINGYRYRIFEKLGISNDVELTLMAIRHGLLEDVEQNTLEETT